MRKTKSQRYPLVLPLLSSLSDDACEEFRFHPVRKWRADFAIPGKKLLIEIDGGVWSGGRHTRGGGFIGDMEKLNAAACLGYLVLRYQPSETKAKKITKIIEDIKACLATRS